MGCGPEPKNDRNWAVWREFHAGKGPGHVLGAKYDLSASRVIQIVRRCDRQLKAALNSKLNPTAPPLDDAVRDGLQGVEFTFTMADPWNEYKGRKGWDQLNDGSWFQFSIGASDE